MLIVSVISKLSFEISGFHDITIRNKMFKSYMWSLHTDIQPNCPQVICTFLRKRENLLDLNETVVNLWVQSGFVMLPQGCVGSTVLVRP